MEQESILSELEAHFDDEIMDMKEEVNDGFDQLMVQLQMQLEGKSQVKGANIQPPKRPYSAYQRFAMAHYQFLKSRHPTFDQVQLFEQIAKEWNNLKPELKQSYMEDYDRDLEKYDQVKKIYDEVPLANPKKPNAYIIFQKEFISNNKLKYQDRDQMTKEVAKAWKTLSSNDKELYEQKVVQLKKQFEDFKIEDVQNLHYNIYKSQLTSYKQQKGLWDKYLQTVQQELKSAKPKLGQIRSTTEPKIKTPRKEIQFEPPRMSNDKEIDLIIGIRRKQGKKEYLVRWRGETSSQATWVKRSQMREHKEMVHLFEQTYYKSQFSSSSSSGFTSSEAAEPWAPQKNNQIFFKEDLNPIQKVAQPKQSDARPVTKTQQPSAQSKKPSAQQQYPSAQVKRSVGLKSKSVEDRVQSIKPQPKQTITKIPATKPFSPPLKEIQKKKVTVVINQDRSRSTSLQPQLKQTRNQRAQEKLNQKEEAEIQFKTPEVKVKVQKTEQKSVESKSSLKKEIMKVEETTAFPAAKSKGKPQKQEQVSKSRSRSPKPEKKPYSRTMTRGRYSQLEEKPTISKPSLSGRKEVKIEEPPKTQKLMNKSTSKTKAKPKSSKVDIKVEADHRASRSRSLVKTPLKAQNTITEQEARTKKIAKVITQKSKSKSLPRTTGKSNLINAKQTSTPLTTLPSTPRIIRQRSSSLQKKAQNVQVRRGRSLSLEKTPQKKLKISSDLAVQKSKSQKVPISPKVLLSQNKIKKLSKKELQRDSSKSVSKNIKLPKQIFKASKLNPKQQNKLPKKIVKASKLNSKQQNSRRTRSQSIK